MGKILKFPINYCFKSLLWVWVQLFIFETCIYYLLPLLSNLMESRSFQIYYYLPLNANFIAVCQISMVWVLFCVDQSAAAAKLLGLLNLLAVTYISGRGWKEVASLSLATVLCASWRKRPTYVFQDTWVYLRRLIIWYFGLNTASQFLLLLFVHGYFREILPSLTKLILSFISSFFVYNSVPTTLLYKQFG